MNAKKAREITESSLQSKIDKLYLDIIIGIKREAERGHTNFLIETEIELDFSQIKRKLTSKGYTVSSYRNTHNIHW